MTARTQLEPEYVVDARTYCFDCNRQFALYSNFIKHLTRFHPLTADGRRP